MAKHKAPTEVTIVSSDERQGFGKWVERYWKPAAAFGVLTAGAVMAIEYTRGRAVLTEQESWDALNGASQDQLVARGSRNAYYAVRVGESAELQRVVEAEGDSVAAPWALASLAESYLREESYEQAQATLDQLRTKHPDSFLAGTRFRFGEDATPRTLVEHATREVQDWSTWKAEHAGLFQNPELPADAPKVRIRTDQGAILVGLFTDLAPKHAENFLARCREGYYDGTLFHRVVAGFMIQGGDPNTRDGDPSTWGQGGPETGVPKEVNSLRHFEGVLAAAKSDPKGDSSGSQFYITVDSAHSLDADYTVFGKLLEGNDLVQSVAEGEIAEGTQDRPANPVRILGTDVL